MARVRITPGGLGLKKTPEQEAAEAAAKASVDAEASDDSVAGQNADTEAEQKAAAIKAETNKRRRARQSTQRTEVRRQQNDTNGTNWRD